MKWINKVYLCILDFLLFDRFWKINKKKYKLGEVN